MKDYIKPLLKKCPTTIFLHIVTNNTINETSREVLDGILSLKHFIERELSDCKVIISNITKRLDEGKASLTVLNTNEHLKQLEIELIDNGNIGDDCLLEGGLHLNSKGSGKLAMNFIKKIKKLKKK